MKALLTFDGVALVQSFREDQAEAFIVIDDPDRYAVVFVSSGAHKHLDCLNASRLKFVRSRLLTDPYMHNSSESGTEGSGRKS